MKTIRTINERYGKRVLAQNLSVSNNTRLTGMNNNDLIIGGSGCGKTGSYVIPNIQNINGSLVVSDTKGQLYRRFHSELRKKGYKVACIDFCNPEKSVGYNPLAAIRRNPDGLVREHDILTIARVICPDELIRDETIWAKSAANYIAFLIAYCLDTEPVEKQNMLTVTDLHRRFNKSKDNSEILDWLYEHPQSFAAKKYDEINAIRAAERMYASIMGFVNAGLELFNYRESEYLFGQKRSFDINSLGRKKTVLFINTSDTNRTMDNLIILFYNQALQLLNADADATKDGRLKVPVRIIMDDFAASSTIPDFDKVTSVIRSRDISVSLIIQSLSQLQSLYNSAVSSTIINNCDHLLYMGSQDIDTANFISARTCMTPESVLRMPRDRVCVITNGEKARWFEKIQPYSTTVYFDPVEVSGECFM